MALRGRSQLVESFVWLVSPARIDRLIALSLSRGAWPFFVRRVICLVPPRFCVHLEKEKEKREEKEKRGKRIREREEKREEENKRKRKKRGGEEEKKRKNPKKIT